MLGSIQEPRRYTKEKQSVKLLRARSWLSWSGIVLAVLIPATFLWSQTSPEHATPAKKSEQAEAAKPKLTPEQERGLRLLKAAEAEAAGLQPDMRAFVLWRVAHAYESSDRKKAERLADDAFAATQQIEDPPIGEWCAAPGSAGDIKGWVQQQVLYAKIHKDKVDQVRQMLPQATAPTRDGMTAELVRYYKSKKDLSQAQSMLAQLADSNMYPFEAAADLVEAMGPEQSADRVSIFTQAINNYQQHPNTGVVGPGNVGSFVERTWREVPSGMVLEAIDKILEAAKDKDDGPPMHYSLASTKGNVVLNSRYDLRLFELLPILEQLDKDKADNLLREHTELAGQLKAYPNGVGSLRAESQPVSYGVVGNETPISSTAARQQVQAQLQDRVYDVLKKTDADPSGALASARALPVQGAFEMSSPRAEALLQIAERTAKKKPSVAKSALEDFAAIQDQLTLQQMGGIGKVPELYLAVTDLEGASRAVKMMVKAAEKLYARDTDTDDPNKAFKGAWPSTDMWRVAIKQAAKISPAMPEEILADLQDPEIAAYEKIAYGGALLGESGMNAPIIVSDCRKNGGSFRVSF